MSRKPRQRGAAILLAMLMVTLVASLSAAALWQQWRGIALESAERERLQSAWILQGALDWARLILREDARNGGTDHLAEPWAVPLQEARLSSFLGATTTTADAALLDEVFLSGEITDLQGRLNVRNLVDDGKLHAPSVLAFRRLFDALGLPDAEVTLLANQLRLALEAGNSAPLLPHTAGQLRWLGLPEGTVLALAPYVTVLPERTTLNLNTAPALVLRAAVSGLSMSEAQTWVQARAQTPFRATSDAPRAVDHALTDSQFGVSSRFFAVRAELRLGTHVLQEVTAVQRDGQLVKVLWRERRPRTQGSAIADSAAGM